MGFSIQNEYLKKKLIVELFYLLISQTHHQHIYLYSSVEINNLFVLSSVEIRSIILNANIIKNINKVYQIILYFYIFVLKSIARNAFYCASACHFLLHYFFFMFLTEVVSRAY